MVLSTVVGDGNSRSTSNWPRPACTPARLPVLSFTIGEDEVRELPIKDLVGDYAGGELLPVDRQPRESRVRPAVQGPSGADRPTSDAIVAAYNAREPLGAGGRGIGYRRHGRGPQGDPEESLERPGGRDVGRRRHAPHLAALLPGKIRRTASSRSSGPSRSRCGRSPTRSFAPGRTGSAFFEKLYTTWGTSDFNPQTLTDPLRPRALVPALSSTRRGPVVPATALSNPRRPDPINDRLTGHELEQAISESGSASRRGCCSGSWRSR